MTKKNSFSGGNRSGKAPADRNSSRTGKPAGRHGRRAPSSAQQSSFGAMPDKDAIRKFVQDNPHALNKREIARAFGIKGQDRTQLRVLLREMAEEGLLEKTAGKSFAAPNSLPERAIIEISGPDDSGDLRAKPCAWAGSGAPPDIFVIGGTDATGRLKTGDRVLARLNKIDADTYEARVLKAQDDTQTQQQDDTQTQQIVGVYKPYKGGGVVYPTDKKIKEDYFIPAPFANGAEEGDLVLAELLPPSAQYPKSKNAARVAERLGKKDDPRLISLIAIHSHSIPTVFPADALAEAQAMAEPDLSGGRADLRALPLVTIDGADARDFDDAVFAEQDADPKNAGGWHLVVAIADVSFYVRPKSALDRTAYERGNSTYFADRVVPMLPERLSNDLCSLRPKVNRACLAVHMWIDKDANLLRYTFVRALMRSAARLTYEQVEDAHMGKPDETTQPLLQDVIAPLYKAYSLLKHAREKRGALDLDLPERKAVIDKTGHVTAIVPRQRLNSHQLIEEFMILANVAAARALEDKHAPCLYRVHAPPAFDRLEATREFLKELGYSLPKSDQLHPRNINHILHLSAAREDKNLVHTMLLRTQSQAVYAPDNIGHFGLALEKYAHFTSPIRRYADLVVHRSLVHAFGLGAGGLTEDDAQGLDDIAEHITVTERRSMLAERDVTDRFTAQYLSANVGGIFKGRISSVTHFGLFIALDDTGADGILPMRNLPRDYYIHDEKHHALIGKNTGRSFRLSDPVVVRLLEADPMRGSTVFELVSGEGEEEEEDGFGARRRPRPQHRRGERNGGHRHHDARGEKKDGEKRNNGRRGGKKRRR